MNKFSEILKEQRKAAGKSIRELAEVASLDPSLISRYESGNRMPPRAHLMALATALNTNNAQLESAWLAQRLYDVMKDASNNEVQMQALQIAEDAVAYEGSKKKPAYPTGLKQKIKELNSLKKELAQHRKNDSYRIQQALELEYTFNSNRIEGNTLTLQETDVVINEGITIAGKSMREHLEAINHNDAILFIKELVKKKNSITESNVLKIHNLILRGIDPQNAGKYRNVQVMIKGSSHLPPQPFLVGAEMEKLFLWYGQYRNILHPVMLAAEMHQRLVNIHPFIDGNGRTSRLLMNLILLQNGFVIANIKGDNKNRLAYYQSLEDAHNMGKTGFLEFVAQVEIECLQQYLYIIGS